jgi:hypothetical protein
MERKVMNDKFDELAKGMAQSVTRRGALKKFGVGLAGIALAVLGLPNEAHAAKPPFRCRCGEQFYGCDRYAAFSDCTTYCGLSLDKQACGGGALVRLLRKLLP